MDGALASAEDRHCTLSDALATLSQRTSDVEAASDAALCAAAAEAGAAAMRAEGLEARLREAERMLDGAMRLRGLSFEKVPFGPPYGLSPHFRSHFTSIRIPLL